MRTSLKIFSGVIIFSLFIFGCIKEDCTTTPSAPLAKPATDIDSTSFTANWNRVLGGYHIFDVSIDSSFTNFVFSFYEGHLVGSGNSHQVYYLSANTTYYYRVYATNNCGQSEYSNTISVTTQ